MGSSGGNLPSTASCYKEQEEHVDSSRLAIRDLEWTGLKSTETQLPTIKGWDTFPVSLSAICARLI